MINLESGAVEKALEGGWGGGGNEWGSKPSLFVTSHRTSRCDGEREESIKKGRCRVRRRSRRASK